MAGILGDRIGGRLTFVVGLGLFAIGTLGFVRVGTFGQAIGPAVAFGAAGGLTWLGLYAMIGEEVPPARRPLRGDRP